MSAQSADETAFFAAITSGDHDTMRRLAAANPALLRATDPTAFGATPLNTAIWPHPDRPTAELLVALGADVNQASDWPEGPWTPGMLAILENQRELAEWLVAQGATVDVHLAAGLGDHGRLATLLATDPACVSALGGDGCTPLHVAADPETAQLLLAAGADMDARCADHWSTPAQWAARRRPELATWLMDQGAEADIFTAIIAGSLLWTERLLDGDPVRIHWRMDQVCYPPKPGTDTWNINAFHVGLHATPLHAAALSPSTALVDLLLDRGHSIHATGGYDDATALHLAAWHNRPDMVAHLLAKGADLDRQSGSMHRTIPLIWAIVAGACDATTALLDGGADCDSAAVQTSQHGVDGAFDDYIGTPRSERRRLHEMLLARQTG